jgi:hypothetical protein
MTMLNSEQITGGILWAFIIGIYYFGYYRGLRAGREERRDA